MDDAPQHQSGYKPITTVEQVNALDPDLLVAGYQAGLRNTPDYTQRDQAYWHGYMNGQVDKGYMPISLEQQQLAHNLVSSGWTPFARRDHE